MWRYGLLWYPWAGLRCSRAIIKTSCLDVVLSISPRCVLTFGRSCCANLSSNHTDIFERRYLLAYWPLIGMLRAIISLFSYLSLSCWRRLFFNLLRAPTFRTRVLQLARFPTLRVSELSSKSLLQDFAAASFTHGAIQDRWIMDRHGLWETAFEWTFAYSETFCLLHKVHSIAVVALTSS